MKHFKSIGLLLVFWTILLVSCTSDNVQTSSSQVENHEVVFSVFEQSTTDLETRTESSGGKSLKECRIFSELEFALIPKGGNLDKQFVVRQDDSMDDFGQVKMYVPSGTYYLVAIAANTPKPIDKENESNRIDIKSTSEVDFPNNQVTDMAYLYKEITISSTEKSQGITCTLKRGVTAFVLKSADFLPANRKSFKLSISGNCGNVFNPSTGHCASKALIEKDYDISKIKVSNTIEFNLFLILGDDDTDDITVTATSLDDKGATIKSTLLSNVHLVTGKKTTYKGPLFSQTNNLDMTIVEEDLPDSGYDQTFD